MHLPSEQFLLQTLGQPEGALPVLAVELTVRHLTLALEGNGLAWRDTPRLGS